MFRQGTLFEEPRLPVEDADHEQAAHEDLALLVHYHAILFSGLTILQLSHLLSLQACLVVSHFLLGTI